MKRKPMRVVAVAATKGGVGKTTLSSALAVRAAEESGRVALIDADPSASLSRWWELRGEPKNPSIVALDCSAEAIGLLMSDGWEWVFIDTPPALVDQIEQAIMVADFVLIPTRPSALDVEALDQVVELCRTARKPFAFVINAVQTDRKGMAASAAKFLSHDGRVLDVQIADRKSYVTAMTLGKSGPEVERGEHARREIDALLLAITEAIADASSRKPKKPRVA